MGSADADGRTGNVAATVGEPSGQEETGATTGPPSAEEVAATAGEFLDAWAAGDTAAAAALTDRPDEAEAALGALTADAGFEELTLVAGTPTGEDVPFSVTAAVAHEGEQGELAYDSALTVVRDTESGKAVVAWAPTVIHPELTEGRSLVTGPVSEVPPVEMLDRHGDVIAADEFPSLTPILSQLAERYGEQAGGSAGAETRIVDAEGETVTSLLEIAEPAAGQVPTTIDPVIQRAAEEAVADSGRASLVAIDVGTGAIQAVANNPADGFNGALEGSWAPGSTFKVVTSSLLIDRGLASADAPHPCPKYFEYGGWRFQNDDEFEISGGTFADSFARSCNTAFISQAPELSDSDLGDQARDVFGLGLDWQVGVTTLDGAVPTQSDAQMAASLIGQGGVRMNPLTMASVSATVRNGAFQQPYLVPPEFDGRQLAQAPDSLSAGTAQQLRELMNRTARNGTAAEAMAGLEGDVGAKTGSAEVDGQEKPNAWFTAYRDDLAVAAVVPNSGHGGEFAGPVVADVLRAGS
ncbi:penicillin-binding transpeptidase domain-containing protein [Streptomyces specialis]|uniref:penicillin-binding transpeptidase domain-containing protein n=1 Tax=Streptomyces specialis TaxID=498367 RepID=UPI001F264178|nr:penicillin-binding transpeptidase domain-containing protein [Streptomyces specialis]